MIILNTKAAFYLHAWCLCGHHVVRSGVSLSMLKRRRKAMKAEGCPKCGSSWISFRIGEER